VYLSQLRPLASSVPDSTMIPTLNAPIATLVRQVRTAGTNVSLVSVGNITTANLYDGVHPDPSGYATMAANWYPAIIAQQPSIGGTSGGTGNTISAGLPTSLAAVGNDVLIGNASNNILNGSAGNDVLIPGGGNTMPIGGLARVQFDIKSIAGQISILDLTPLGGDIYPT
jgi:trimeric autotransporter adhesin